jgi:hypothetical protein
VAKDFLDPRLREAGVWRGIDPATPVDGPRQPTGWPRLDHALAGGGWPLGTLIELLLPAHGLGELRLLIPALRAQARATDASSRWIVWVSPPHEPYPPALAQSGLPPGVLLRVEAPQPADRLWATEQVLRSGSAAAVLCWLDAADDRWLRRLKLAAEGQPVLLVALRPAQHRRAASPAALRLELLPGADGQGVDAAILKERGRSPRQISGVFSH